MIVLLLRYTGEGEKPQADIDRINGIDGVAVVNSQLPRSVVVHAAGEEQKTLLASIPGWEVSVPRIETIEVGVDRFLTHNDGIVVSQFIRPVPNPE